MTSYALRSASPAKTRADVVVVGVVPGDGKKGTAKLAAGGEEVAEAYGRKLAPLLASLDLTGKPGEVAKVPTGETLNAGLLVLVGLGAEPGPDAVRRAAGEAARAVSNAASVALALPAETPEEIRAAIEGFELGGYTFTSYRSNGKNDDAKAEIVLLSPIARRQEAIDALAVGLTVATAVATTRDLVNIPPGDLRPPKFAEQISTAVRAANKSLTTKVKVKTYDEAKLAELRCGGILSVGQGSDAPPRLVEVTWSPKDARAHLALVGKGITFDSGGLSLKPANSMATMKMDMAGAATVVMATLAIADLGLPIKVTAFAALAENMISGNATRPGDIVVTRSGKTVEIGNTDAEGRMVLADALTIATERKPDLMVDVATLTGAMMVALGDEICGVLGDEETVQQVLDAAETVGEPAWPMPIHEVITERVKSSKVADLAQHDFVRWGGGLFAAAFLQQFTEGVPWAHMDIAGPAYNTGGAAGHRTPGGTGYGVATLVELARSLAD